MSESAKSEQWVRSEKMWQRQVMQLYIILHSENMLYTWFCCGPVVHFISPIPIAFHLRKRSASAALGRVQRPRAHRGAAAGRARGAAGRRLRADAAVGGGHQRRLPRIHGEIPGESMGNPERLEIIEKNQENLQRNAENCWFQFCEIYRYPSRIVV